MLGTAAIEEQQEENHLPQEKQQDKREEEEGTGVKEKEQHQSQQKRQQDLQQAQEQEQQQTTQRSKSARTLKSSKSFDAGQLDGSKKDAKSLVTEQKRSVDDSDVSLTVSKTAKRSSWRRLKRIITDNKGILGRLSPEDEQQRALKERNSCEFDYDIINKVSDVTIRRKDSGQIRRRKSSSPIFRKPPRLYRNKYSLENLLQLAIVDSNESAMVKIISNDKVDVNFLHAPGTTALHQACVLGNLTIIKLLIQNGADVEMKTWSGLSAVQVATLFGHFDVAQYLIQEGASCKDIQDGFTYDVKLMSTIFIRSY